MQKTILVLLIMIVLGTNLVAQNAQVDFITPEFVEYLKPLHLRLDIIRGNESIEEVYLFYKKGNIDYTQVLMEPGEGMNPYYEATIPAFYINQAISFYFRILLSGGEEQTIPSVDPINNPYYVSLKPEDEPLADTSFILLSPDQEYNFQDDDFMVAISYFSIQDQMKHKTLKLFINGNDVSAQAVITENLLVYNPAYIKPGSYKIEVVIYNKDGSIYKKKDWTVKVKKVPTVQRLPISVHGDILIDSRLTLNDADTGSYYYDKDDELKTIGRLRLKGERGFFRYRGMIYISSEEKSSRQPYNRYSLDLYVPDLQLNIGDHNQVFSNTTIAGKNVRGVGGELNFGFFKLHSFYGQIQRHITGTQDTTSTPYDTTYTGGYYDRNTLGVRLRFGNERTFYVGLNAVKTKDDMGSEKYAQNPKDNIVIGLDSKLSLCKRRFQFGWEVAASLLNNDISAGVISQNDLDSLGIELPFDPESIENIFVINTNVEPYKLSMSNIAAEGFIRAFFLNNLLNMKYSYIGGSFHTLANPYLQNDKTGLHIMDNVTLLNNQLSVGIGYHTYNDNIRSTKKSTTYTRGFLFNAGYYPRGNMPNMSANMQQINVYNEVTDTSLVPVNQINTITTLNTSYKLPVHIFSPTDTRFSLSYSYSNTADRDENNYDYSSNNIRFGLDVNFKEIPASSHFTFGYLARQDRSQDSTEVKSSYFTFGIKEEFRSQIFKKGSFRTTIGYNFTNSSGDSPYMKHYLSFGINNRFLLFASETMISLQCGYMIYNDINDEAKNYNQMRGILKFTQRF